MEITEDIFKVNCARLLSNFKMTRQGPFKGIKWNETNIADPKGKTFSKYNGATIITPNTKEVEIATNVEINDHRDAENAAKKILSITNSEAVLITRGKNGMTLLEASKKKAFHIVNVDAIVVAESPKLAPYRQEMQMNISKTLKVSSDCINIKATTTEGLGFIGNKEGVGAMCVVLLQSGLD